MQLLILILYFALWLVVSMILTDSLCGWRWIMINLVSWVGGLKPAAFIPRTHDTLAWGIHPPNMLATGMWAGSYNSSLFIANWFQQPTLVLTCVTIGTEVSSFENRVSFVTLPSLSLSGDNLRRLWSQLSPILLSMEVKLMPWPHCPPNFA